MGALFHILRHRFSRQRLKLWSLHIWAAWKATNDQWGFPRRFAGFLSASRFFFPLSPTSRRPTGQGLLLFNLRLQECRGFDGFTVASLTNGSPGNCIEADYFERFFLGWLFIPKPRRSGEIPLTAPINLNICNRDFFVAPQSPIVLNKTFFFQLISLSGFIHNGKQDCFMGPAVLNT